MSLLLIIAATLVGGGIARVVTKKPKAPNPLTTRLLGIGVLRREAKDPPASFGEADIGRVLYATRCYPGTQIVGNSGRYACEQCRAEVWYLYRVEKSPVLAGSRHPGTVTTKYLWSFCSNQRCGAAFNDPYGQTLNGHARTESVLDWLEERERDLGLVSTERVQMLEADLAASEARADKVRKELEALRQAAPVLTGGPYRPMLTAKSGSS